MRSRGLLSPALAWEVRYGPLLATCAAAIAVFTLWLATLLARATRPRQILHVAFLLLVGMCFAVRAASGDARRPRDPSPLLLQAIRAAAAQLDRTYAGSYASDATQFSFAQVTPPYRRLGKPIPLRARVLSAAEGPQLQPLPGDAPGTIYVAISGDGQSAWVTALGADAILSLPSRKPAVAEAHAGKHSDPGGDPALPAYPGARSIGR